LSSVKRSDETEPSEKMVRVLMRTGRMSEKSDARLQGRGRRPRLGSEKLRHFVSKGGKGPSCTKGKRSAGARGHFMQLHQEGAHALKVPHIPTDRIDFLLRRGHKLGVVASTSSWSYDKIGVSRKGVWGIPNNS